MKDEEGRLESDSNDGRITPSLAGPRGTKRPKHNHPGHHHHHLYSHQYVHLYLIMTFSLTILQSPPPS